MHDNKQQPSWWLLYLCLPLMIGLFLIEMRLSLTDTGHRLAEIIIILVVYGYMRIWLNANTGALIQEDLERWRAALNSDSSLVPPQSVTIVGTNENLNPWLRRVWGSISKWLAGLASVIAGFFHRRETSDANQIRP
jgi:hypothetical protein